MNSAPRHRRPRPNPLRPILTLFAVLVGVLGLSLATVAPASAGLGEGSTQVGAWEALDTDDGTGNPYPGVWTPEVGTDPSTSSGFDGPTSAHLGWSEGGPNLGTSLEIADLNLELAEGGNVAVSWVLDDGAQYVAGGPRIFVEIDDVYYNSFGNVHSSEYGAEIHDLPAGTVGHVGIVYDNGVAGTVNVDVFHFWDSTGDIQVWYPSGGTSTGEANEFGQNVATYVKEHGGPPPHAKAKGLQ